MFLIALTVFIGVIAVFNFLDDKDKAKKVVQNQTQKSSNVKRVKNSLKINEASSIQSTESEKISSSELKTKTSDSEKDRQAVFENYLTIELNQDALTKRQAGLKATMTDDLYQKLSVASDTNILKKMLSDWTDKKIMNSNMPVQLLEQDISDIKVSENVQDKNQMMVQVFLKLTSPMSPTPAKASRIYSVTFSGDKMSDINLLDESVVK
ncbi:hypothetical protein [Pseudolactococcus insecticola]|nr:hypothetical protein [Lactococcus insecticola]